MDVLLMLSFSDEWERGLILNLLLLIAIVIAIVVAIVVAIVALYKHIVNKNAISEERMRELEERKIQEEKVERQREISKQHWEQYKHSLSSEEPPSPSDVGQ